MSGAFYELYRSKVFELAKTMVIKFDPAAHAINKELKLNGHLVDETDKRTWKYYMNLAGQYHSTDTMMTITSLDDPGQTIDFTVANLQANRITREEYRYGSRFYKRLVDTYPDQETLILGIINPVDVDVAVEAADGTILQYDAKLVEENETNLIPDLEDWIQTFFARWHINDYGLVDELYVASVMGVLFSSLAQQIMNIRLKNCKTQRAHSYHIREYLESNGRLAPFIQYLTKKQALWLYRNIRYIHRNAGTQRTFMKLVENILSERNIPIAEYDIRHNLGSIAEDLHPTLTMRRTAINFSHVGAGSDVRGPDYVLEKEAEITFMDAEQIAHEEERLNELADKYLGNSLPTKVLESSVVDTTGSVAYPLADVLLNHWIYYAGTGDYVSQIRLSNPSTGETFFVSVKDAIVLYIYAIRKGTLSDPGEEISDVIPKIAARDIRRSTPPTDAQLRDVTGYTYIDQTTIDAALGVTYDFETMTSPEAFYDACRVIQEGMMAHRNIYVRQQHMMSRGIAEGMMASFYEDYLVELEDPGTTFTEWLTAKGIDFTLMQPEDYRTLADSIVQEATGAGVNASKELRNMHQAMIRLMRRLSSYSIQILRTINSSSRLIIDYHTTRVGDQDSMIHDNEEVEIPMMAVTDFAQRHHETMEFPIRGEHTTNLPDYSGGDKLRVNYRAKVGLTGTFNQTMLVPVTTVNVIEEVEGPDALTDAVGTTNVEDYTYPNNDFYDEGD